MGYVTSITNTLTLILYTKWEMMYVFDAILICKWGIVVRIIASFIQIRMNLICISNKNSSHMIMILINITIRMDDML